MDKIGRLPKTRTPREALKEILYIASDKRGHVLLDEHCAWLELKLRAIRTLARRQANRRSSRPVYFRIHGPRSHEEAGH